jgi:hypothetical protein
MLPMHTLSVPLVSDTRLAQTNILHSTNICSKRKLTQTNEVHIFLSIRARAGPGSAA